MLHSAVGRPSCSQRVAGKVKRVDGWGGEGWMNGKMKRMDGWEDEEGGWEDDEGGWVGR